MLGITISIAVVVAMITLASTLRTEFGSVAAYTNADLVIVQKAVSGLMNHSINETRIEEIEKGYEEVELATGYLVASLRMTETRAITIVGIDPDNTGMFVDETHVAAGRFFEENSGEIVLGKAAQKIHGADLGDILTFEGTMAFTVVGIYETGNAVVDNAAVISLQDAQQLTNSEAKVTLIALHLSPGADPNAVGQKIEEDMPSLKVQPADQLLEETMSESMQRVNMLAWVISTIAVVMGMIGTANIMTLAVSERTREIGILRAIGYGPTKIMKLILGESLVLSLVGAIVGGLLGILAVCSACLVPEVKAYVTPSFTVTPLLIGLGVAVLLGLVGGAYPAYRACRVSPAEALRHE